MRAISVVAELLDLYVIVNVASRDSVGRWMWCLSLCCRQNHRICPILFGSHFLFICDV